MPKTMPLLCLLFAPLLSVADTDSHREATLELMEVMRQDEIIKHMHAQFEPLFRDMGSDMDMSAEQRQLFERQTEHTLEVMRELLSWSQMEPYMVQAHMNVYTEEEIREIIVFYSSPTGQKMLDRMPQLMEESMRLTRQMMQDVMPRIQELQEELRAELAELQ